MNRTVKACTYSILMPFGERFLAYNGLTNSLGLMDRATHQFYSEICDRKVSELPPALDQSTRERTEALRAGMFMVDSDFDELAYIKSVSRSRRYGNTVLSLTILPTLNCNFACSYCFEGRRPSRSAISDATISAILSMVQSQAKQRQPVSVVWFGGEPLLEADACFEMDESIRSTCESGSSTYRSSMVTNGYLLATVDMARLASSSIRSVQVTLDGDRETHDSRRFLHDGSQTFDTILAGIQSVLRHTRIKVSLRVNIDRTNVGNIDSLLACLTEAGLLKQERISLHFAPVSATTSTGECSLHAASCFAPREYSGIQVDLYRKLVEYGMKLVPYPNGGFVNCGAIVPTSLVVLPDGEIHKCWETVGSEDESCGNISDLRSMRVHPNYLKWTAFDPFDREDCLKCSILPVCMGGCPRQAMESGGRDTLDVCPPWRFNVEEMIGLFALVKTAP